ncbi:MAG: hypothetical protein HRF48_08210 [Chloroflexota bacterium]|jgi:hypothetical protein
MSTLWHKLQAATSGAIKMREPQPKPEPQREERKDKARASLAGYVTVHDTTLAAQAVRSWLAEMAMPGVKTMRGGGGGTVITAGRLVIDSSGYGGGNGRQTPTGEMFYGVGQGAFDLGTLIFQNRFLRIYPLLGVGGMGGGATCTTEAGANERCGTQWGALLLRGGVGIDVILRVWRVGVLIGFRFGYQSASYHLQYGDGPEIGAPEGPFFRVVGGPFLLR